MHHAYAVGRLSILFGLFSVIAPAFAQAQHAPPHQMTQAEAMATVQALQDSHASFYFSAAGKENGLPWAITAGAFGGGSGTSIQGPYILFPLIPYYPTVEPAQTIRAPLRTSLEDLNKEQPRPAVTRPVPSYSRRVSTADRAKAEKLLAQGDASFAKEKLDAAVAHYASAARLAPDWADPHFRRGFALVAQGNYSKAVTAFRAGLKLRSDWSDSEFRLDTIYAAGALEKANEKLAVRLNRNQLDHDVLFAKGMQLFFAGDRQRSAIFLSQAASLEGNDPELLEAFLEPREVPSNSQ